MSNPYENVLRINKPHLKLLTINTFNIFTYEPLDFFSMPDLHVSFLL